MAGEKYFSIIPLAYLAAESIPFAEIAMTSASITFRSESGFTLMELMMVITIVSVLTVASLTPISNTIDQSRFDETVSRIKVWAASPTFIPFWMVPMIIPPIIFTTTIRIPAIASPRTNFEAPSMAP